MDQLVNQAAKIHYMSGGRLKAPLLVRTTLGATRRSAAQHSLEDKMMFATKGPVPEDEYTLELGRADVKREGEDVTIVATSSMVYVALDAADLLAAEGVSAEAIDPRTLVPLDREALVASAKKTGRAIVVDEGHRSYGASAEPAAVIADGAFYHFDAPVKRAAAMDVPIPFSPVLEDQNRFDKARRALVALPSTVSTPNWRSSS